MYRLFPCDTTLYPIYLQTLSLCHMFTSLVMLHRGVNNILKMLHGKQKSVFKIIRMLRVFHWNIFMAPCNIFILCLKEPVFATLMMLIFNLFLSDGKWHFPQSLMLTFYVINVAISPVFTLIIEGTFFKKLTTGFDCIGSEHRYTNWNFYN